jgi:hypothetical protein
MQNGRLCRGGSGDYSPWRRVSRRLSRHRIPGRFEGGWDVICEGYRVSGRVRLGNGSQQEGLGGYTCAARARGRERLLRRQTCEVLTIWCGGACCRDSSHRPCAQQSARPTTYRIVR